ncbi:MAG: F0F1 ATP synthase subunit delta [Sulfurimonas sp.]|jgi:F-type H+-transporting ATPase subunit delta|nr:F0F1 ATP synthase subunit delta [Sulfurimonas sp.]
MEELIAKRYIKAFKEGLDAESMKNATLLFDTLAKFFEDAKFVEIMSSSNVSKEQKLDILLASVKPAKSSNIDSLIKLLVEKNRIEIIPAMAESMRKDTAHTDKTYKGNVYSDSDLDTKVIEDLSSGLSKKFDSNISLSFVKDNFNGIKVDVEDLGIEINFSKTRINDQIIQHIIKAI